MNTNSTWNNGTPTNLGWSNYGIWNNNSPINGTNMNPANGTVTNTVTGVDNNSTRGSYDNSSSSNSAYGTPNATVPYNVQMNYSKDYSSAASSNGTWSQYGDWFYTTYMSNGRYSQIMYDGRGNGYSLALPVLNTYVPENVVAMALQKYGSTLYSITALKSADGKDAYQINLLNRGQTKMEWIGDDGATASSIYRTEEMNNDAGNMNATQTNAAMDNSSSTTTTTTTVTDEESTMNDRADKDTNEKGKKTKTKMKNDDGTTKPVTKPGDVKMKTKPHSAMKKDNKDMNNRQQ